MTQRSPGRLPRWPMSMVNDAFGSAHRAHASTEGITHYLKPAVAGLLMEKEITYLGKALQSPEKPFVAIIGGSKISGKIDVIQTSSTRLTPSSSSAEWLTPSTEHSASPSASRSSKKTRSALPKRRWRRRRPRGVNLLLPVDNILADSFSNDAKTQPWDTSKDFPADWQGSRHRTQIRRGHRRRDLARPAQSSGTAPPASSNFPTSPREPTPSPTPSQLTKRRPRLLAAAIP